MRPLPVLLLLCVSLTAGEAPPPDPKAEARRLHGEASRAMDLWTLLQLEAWGAANDARLRSAVSGATCHGTPLLATPSRLIAWTDTGERVLAAAGDRIHTWAPDGRPLALTRRLPFRPDTAAFAEQGGAVGFASVESHGGLPTSPTDIRLGALPLAGEAEAKPGAKGRGEAKGVDRVQRGAPGERIRSIVVADDGSAVAVSLLATPAPVQPERLLVATANGVRVEPGYDRVHAIGPGGAWVAARRSDGGSVVIDVKRGVHPYRSLASAEGTAFAVGGDRAFIVRPDGSVADWTPPIGTSGSASLQTVGTCLVLFSGWNARTRETTDLLGNPVPGGESQPLTCAIWRWRDILADPAAEPLGMENNVFSTLQYEPSALIARRGDQVVTLDLAAASLEPRPLVKAAGEVAEARWSGRHLLVRLAGQRLQVFDAAMTEVWSGEGADMPVLMRDWGVLASGRWGEQTYAAVRLDPDAAKRASRPLALPPGQYRWDPGRDLAVASDRERSWWAFRNDGAPQGNGGALMPAPQPQHDWESSGRFVERTARLLRRGAELDDSDRWAPRDAWRIGRALLVLDDRDRIWAQPPRGKHAAIGSAEGAARFALIGDAVGVIDRADTPVAVVVPGPALDLKVRGRPVTPLGAGPWQVRGTSYVAPRAGSLVWNDDLGATPMLLRSPDSEGLLAIFASLVLDLDPIAAKAVGKPPGR